MQTIEPYLKEMVKREASDLFLTVDCPPSLRIEGKVVEFDLPPVSEEDIEKIITDLMSEDQKYEFESNYELNMALKLEDGERFRVNFFRQQHHSGLVIRRIKAKIPDPQTLKLPPIYTQIVMEKRGLILLVGSVGSGKSTSMASMIEYRNQKGSGHIITVEDPIEYVFTHQNCIFTQREVGIDTFSYSIALKNAMRQSPDVIVIGEIRDRDTMENALLFCETGHLCLATLHATNSSQAIERIINFFPEETHRQMQITLSQNLRAVFSQRLVEDEKNGRALATEILLNEGLIKQLILEGKFKEVKDAMEKAHDHGMQTFDQCLHMLVKKKTISAEVALREADNPNNLRLRINQDRTAMQVSTTGKLQSSLDNVGFDVPSGTKSGQDF
jgi:twitching motility protein PilU